VCFASDGEVKTECAEKSKAMRRPVRSSQQGYMFGCPLMSCQPTWATT
jgi:hypothetical protein